MKKFFSAVLSFAVISSHAQTADAIIQKYTANMGGLEAFNNITSAKLTGIYSIQGNNIALTTQIINGKAMRTDLAVMGQSITNCYYNGKGWKINPIQGITTATEVTGIELNDFKTQSQMASQLMDYKARGHLVVLLGEETVEGINTFKINLTNKDDGKVTIYYIAAADYTLIKSVTERTIQDREMEVESYYSDLKEIGGVKFFMRKDSKIDGQTFQTIKFEKIELNLPVDEKIFNMPK